MQWRARPTKPAFVCADERTPPPRGAPEWANREPEPKRILLVEDDALVRSAVRRMLCALYPDLVVVEANDGDEALDLLDDDIVCVVSDIDMPKRDGIQMCWSIRNAAACVPWCDVPVVLISATCYREEFMLEAWSAGTAFLLKKPFDPSDLAHMIDGAIGARGVRTNEAGPAERTVNGRVLDEPRRPRLAAAAGGVSDGR